MKKIFIFALLFFCIFLVGCKKVSVNNTAILTNSWIVTVVSWVQYPVCIAEKLADVKIITIDDVVKNCTEKNKEWKYLDGLGGAYPQFFIKNNQVLTIFYGEDNDVTGAVCQDDEGKYIRANTKDYKWYYTLPWADVIQNIPYFVL